MRKNILAILAFLFLFILSGCGQTSNKGGVVQGTVAVEMQENQIVLHANGVDFTLPLPFTKELDSSYSVELSDFALSVNGCHISDIAFSPTSLVLDGGLNTQEMLMISGSFDQNCTPTGYTFSATQTVTQNGKTKVEDISFTYDYSGELPEAGYGIINATTPLQIGEESVDYAISMQVTKDGYVAADKTVKLKPFNSQYGTIKTSSTYEVTTDVNGIAQFDYFSPKELPVDGTSTTLEAVVVDENDTVLAGPQSIVLKFDANAPVDIGYELIRETTPIIIATANQVEEISVYLVDSTSGIGASGKNVSLSVPGFGSISASTVVTDGTGKATFSYQAPDTLTDGASTTATLSYTEDGSTITKVVTIEVDVSVHVSDYTLTNQTTPVNIQYAREQKEIKVQLLKNAGTTAETIVVGETVYAQSIPASFGHIQNASAVTDGSGYATFTYIAADPLVNGTRTLELYHEDENGVRVNANVSIVVAAAANPFIYDLINETTPITINTPDQVEEISVYLIDSLTGIGVVGKTVEISVPGFGDMASSSVVTDGAGKATFSYQAPSTLTDGTSTIVNLSFTEDGTTITAPVTINVDLLAHTSDYTLTNQTTPVNVQYASELKEIKVQLLKFAGTPSETIITGETVYAKSIPVAFGIIQNASAVTDGSGYATFSYVAADPLTDGTQPFELYHEDENGARVSATGNIVVAAATPAFDYNLTRETTPITITTSDQEEEISVYLIDSITGIGVSGKTIEASVPGFGDLASSTAVTDGAGKATFSYQAPSTLINGDSTTTALSFTENGTTIAKVVTIDVNTSALPSDYNLTNQTTPINVQYASEQKEIRVQLLKYAGTPSETIVVGETVYAQSIPVAFGIIQNASATTDGSGYATFTYIAADPLTDGTQPFELYHEDENGARVSSTGNIVVAAATQPLDYNLTYETTPILITHADQNEEISAYLIDSVTGVGVPGKIVSIAAIDGIYGAITPASVTTDAAGKATFQYISPHDLNSTPTSTTTAVSFTDNGVTVAKSILISIIPAAEVTDYALINQSDINGTIGVDQTMPTEIQLVKNGIPVIDARACDTVNTVTTDCVIPASIPREYGRLLDHSGSTAGNGYVEFTYQAPSDEIVISNYKFPVYYLDAEGKVAAEANITIDLNVTVESVPPVDYSSYTFTVIPDETNISVGGDQRVIEAFVGNNSQPVEGEPVLVDFTSDTQGRMDSFRALTDVNGHVAFRYTAPNDIIVPSDITVTLRMENNTSKEGTTIVNFTAGPVASFDYNLTRETTPVSVTTPNQVEEISVYLVDKNTWVGVSGKTITLSTPGLGSITSSAAVTDGAGKATFSYQAPAALSTPTSTSATLYFNEDGTTIDKTVIIDINFTAEAQTSDYNVTIVNDSIEVNTARQRVDVVALLTKLNGDIVVGETVYASSIPPAYGYIQNASAVTDSAGHATFTYVAADDPLTLGVQPLEIYHEDGNSVRVNDTVDINVSATPSSSPDYVLGVKKTSYTLTTPKEIGTINVYLADADTFVGVAGETIQVSTPFLVDMSSATAVTNAAGKATFTYQAIDDLEDYDGTSIDPETITFSYPDDLSVSPVTVDLEIDIPSQSSDYNLTNQTTPVNVSYPNEAKEIRVQLLVNGTDIAVGETVYASYLPAAFGYITKGSVVTDGSGYATFKYVAADPLTDGIEQVELYHEDSNGVRVNALVDINVTEAAIPYDYNLTNQSSPVIVTADNQPKEISIYLVNSNTWVGVPGKTITISTIANGYGSVSSASAITNGAGKAIFNYTGPDDLAAVGGDVRGVILSFTESGTAISKTVWVHMNPPTPSPSSYELTNARTPVIVTDADEVQTIDIQLIHNGLPVIDARPCTTDDTVTVDCVIPESIPRDYGRITDATGDPLFDGYIYFDYLSASAEDIVDVNDTNHTFNIYYIDVDGNVAADGNVTLVMP